MSQFVFSSNVFVSSIPANTTLVTGNGGVDTVDLSGIGAYSANYKIVENTNGTATVSDIHSGYITNAVLSGITFLRFVDKTVRLVSPQDIVNFAAGVNTLTVPNGTELVQGNGGLDTLDLSAGGEPAADYSITGNSDGTFLITDLIGGSLTDTVLSGVSYVKFANSIVHLINTSQAVQFSSGTNIESVPYGTKLVIGNGASDTIDFTSVYGYSNYYSVTANADGSYSISDLHGGSLANTKLVGISALKFRDTTVALAPNSADFTFASGVTSAAIPAGTLEVIGNGATDTIDLSVNGAVSSTFKVVANADGTFSLTDLAHGTLTNTLLANISDLKFADGTLNLTNGVFTAVASSTSTSSAALAFAPGVDSLAVPAGASAVTGNGDANDVAILSNPHNWYSVSETSGGVVTVTGTHAGTAASLQLSGVASLQFSDGWSYNVGAGQLTAISAQGSGLPAVTAGLTSSAKTLQVDTPAAGGHVLTVGKGMEFASLSDAIAAAHDNDVIAVLAGSYVDASNYTHNNVIQAKNVTIEGVGGMVTYSMGSQGLANGKGLLVAENGLTLKNFTLTGARDAPPGVVTDGNLAGIRLDAGNLTVVNCAFVNNDDGILGGVAGTTVVIDHSEFANNGSGDGFSHNVYIGPVNSFTLTNSYIHGAVVGQEVKSRAVTTVIENNVIADGPTGTASYDIDIPNGGNATVANNIIEKGPDASNYAMIHYGGETQFQYASNSLTVTGNMLINDAVTKTQVYGGAIGDPTGVSGVANQLALTLGTTGQVITPVISGNQTYNLGPTQDYQWTDDPTYHSAANSVDVTAQNSTLATSPSLPTTSPWSSAPVIAPPTGPLSLTLTTSGNTVNGTANAMTVTDGVGSNTITGGSGGLTLTETGTSATINTTAGAVDTLVIAGRNMVNSLGNDTITLTGNYTSVTTGPGNTTINTGGFYDTLNLGGTDVVNDGSPVTVLQTGVVTVNLLTSSDILYGTLTAGGVLTVNDLGAATKAYGTISGTSATVNGSGGTYGGITVVLTGQNGTVNFVSGSNSVTTDGGTVQIASGSGPTKFILSATLAEHDVITGFKPGTDQLVIAGGVLNTVTTLLAAATTDAAHDTILHLSSTHDIVLQGVSLSQLSASSLIFH